MNINEITEGMSVLYFGSLTREHGKAFRVEMITGSRLVLDKGPGGLILENVRPASVRAV